jgi:hypothetical protein
VAWGDCVNDTASLSNTSIVGTVLTWTSGEDTLQFCLIDR